MADDFAKELIIDVTEAAVVEVLRLVRDAVTGRGTDEEIERLRSVLPNDRILQVQAARARAISARAHAAEAEERGK